MIPMMKKTLFGLILSAALINNNSYAGPADLTSNLLARAETSYIANEKVQIRTAKKNINYDSTLPLSEALVTARSINDEIQLSSQKDLSFIIKDESTYVKIYDYNSDALSDRDFFELNHKFRTNDSIELMLKCSGKDRYEFNCKLNYLDGMSAQTKIDTADLNAFIRWIIRLRTKSMIEKGENTYNEIVDSIDQGNLVQMPYEVVKKTLSEFEKRLPEIRKKDKEDQAFDAFVDLCEIYNKVLKESKK